MALTDVYKSGTICLLMRIMNLDPSGTEAAIAALNAERQQILERFASPLGRAGVRLVGFFGVGPLGLNSSQMHYYNQKRRDAAFVGTPMPRLPGNFPPAGFDSTSQQSRRRHIHPRGTELPTDQE